MSNATNRPGAGSPVVQKVPLGLHWPTAEPFLFCAHHLDLYPKGNGEFGPQASLAGRNIGSDFEGADGWRMYHGSTVPGFPEHPHRGFETITFARQGYIDHSDSMGAAARFGRGDVQWMTAGAGVVHSEMFPLLDESAPNPTELFQIWLNLPAADKMVEPYFTMFWADDIPQFEHVDVDGGVTVVTVIAGAQQVDGTMLVPPTPPPSSWASRPESDLAIWHLVLQPGARFSVQPTRERDTVRVLYVFEGDAALGGDPCDTNTGAVVDNGVAVEIVAGAAGAEVMMLQARPIGEPVAQYGPFVMNTRDEIEQAFDDYRRTGFGGWPWPKPDPVHGADPQRFARHADGRLEYPPSTPRTGRVEPTAGVAAARPDGSV